MPKGGGIPERTAEFNEYLQRVVPMLVKNTQRFYPLAKEINVLNDEWGVRNESAEGGSYPKDSWSYLYLQKINPVTATTVVKKMLRAKRLKMDKMLRTIYNWAVHRFTPEEQAITGRRPRTEKNKRIPVPVRAPQQFISRQIHTEITLCFRDVKFPSLRRKPAGSWYITIEYEIESGKRIIKSGTETTGKTIYRLRVDNKFSGKKIRIRSCYCNRRGKGPWSNWLQAIVI